ncbi:MAG: hypothetical protein JWM93_3973 [Frankiales bacterium]|nr:hypothetical protein [Frankiales bacterium]
MPAPSDGAYGGWPTLGFLVADWIEQHCSVTTGFRKGEPFVMYEPQLRWTVNHYRVRPKAKVGQLAPAFHNRRSQIVGPQKAGKNPWGATIVANEAVGPAVFDGFAGKGDGYACSDHGCGCGWEFDYAVGDPMGIPWPTAAIQLLATSEDQTSSTMRPLQAMIKAGPLGDIMRVGEEFIRIVRAGDDPNARIDVVTSSARARLGNPITFALQDEVGVYNQQNGLIAVARTMRRGLAGMGGRSVQMTNAWDPAENSDAQRTANSQVPDIFYYHRIPPANLSYRDKRERRKIHRFVYEGFDHIDLDSIEAEAAELLELDPHEAERFYGNRLLQGLGAWMPDKLWTDSKRLPA